MNLPLRINLLDWRSAEREYKRKRFITQLIAVAAVTVLVVGVLPVLYFNHLISAQQSRNHYLQAQIKIADKKMAEIRDLKKTREYIKNRMQVINNLQKSRSDIVHYLDQLTATIPDGVFLTQLDQNGKTTTLVGMAASNARVSQYMTNLDDSPWFTNPRLIVIKRKGRGQADFTLKVDSIEPEGSHHSDAPRGDSIAKRG